MASVKKVIFARSKNIKLAVEWNTKGQPLNTKGDNILVSYIGVTVRQNVQITFSSWSNKMLNHVQERIWNNITSTFDVGEEHKEYILKYADMALQQFRTNEARALKMLMAMSTSNFQPNMQISLKRISARLLSIDAHKTLDLDVLWVDTRKNKDDIIDNGKVQEVTNFVVALKEKEGELDPR
ncbi:hypothetical protein Lal_00024391 [Lupinus albus]|nr:hypothetical protein Lal_00024391 [Lupinus albus]